MTQLPPTCAGQTLVASLFCTPMKVKTGQERGSEFLRLANAFSALYPKGSEEKRLVDAMLLAVPR